MNKGIKLNKGMKMTQLQNRLRCCGLRAIVRTIGGGGGGGKRRRASGVFIPLHCYIRAQREAAGFGSSAMRNLIDLTKFINAHHRRLFVCNSCLRGVDGEND